MRAEIAEHGWGKIGWWIGRGYLPAGVISLLLRKGEPIIVYRLINTLHLYPYGVAGINIYVVLLQIKVYISAVKKLIVKSEHSLHLHIIHPQYKAVVVGYVWRVLEIHADHPRVGFIIKNIV